ncbi:hypothetical protein M426DRAFT_21386 [Hypoxylon sp. CI-4A]|nr:hypothetical protein M426DRAFT_21386 [Hypoxylon sp. CI-4A]
MGSTKKVLDPAAVTALPQSSDEDEDDDYRQAAKGLDSDDEESESRRGDIKPSVFSSAQPSSHASNTRRSNRDKSKPSSQSNKVDSLQNEKASSSAGSKRSAEDPMSQMGSHLVDGIGFTKTAANKKHKPNTKRRPTTYGSLSQPRSQLKSSQKSVARSSAPESVQATPDKKFKHFDPLSSPENARPPPARGFVKPESISPEKTSKPPYKHIHLPSDDLPKRVKLETLDPDELSDTATETKSTLSSRRIAQPGKSKIRPPKGAKKKTAVPDEPPKKPVFKFHTLDDSDYSDDSNDKAVVAINDEYSDDETGDVTVESPVAAIARCPMCREAVDEELLAKHSDRGRMNIRKQAAFCRLHKRQTALSSSSQKGYPKIEWKTLDTRLEKHHDVLKGILEGTQESHYRDVLQGNVDSGKNRTLLKTNDSLTPGYYGPRGLRVMTEYIMRSLSSTVRKRAIEDRLVSARGYTGYVQTVLVPELAVRLIMEDMDVAEEDARGIMHDSIEFGELLHEDAGDVIAGLSDDDEDI